MSVKIFRGVGSFLLLLFLAHCFHFQQQILNLILFPDLSLELQHASVLASKLKYKYFLSQIETLKKSGDVSEKLQAFLAKQAQQGQLENQLLTVSKYGLTNIFKLHDVNQCRLIDASAKKFNELRGVDREQKMLFSENKYLSQTLSEILRRDQILPSDFVLINELIENNIFSFSLQLSKNSNEFVNNLSKKGVDAIYLEKMSILKIELSGLLDFLKRSSLEIKKSLSNELQSDLITKSDSKLNKMDIHGLTYESLMDTIFSVEEPTILLNSSILTNKLLIRLLQSRLELDTGAKSSFSESFVANPVIFKFLKTGKGSSNISVQVKNGAEFVEFCPGKLTSCGLEEFMKVIDNFLVIDYAAFCMDPFDSQFLLTFVGIIFGMAVSLLVVSILFHFLRQQLKRKANK